MEKRYQKTAEEYVRNYGDTFLKCTSYIEPRELGRFVRVAPSSFPCLRGASGLFARVDIPRRCLLGFYMGRLIPEEDWQAVLGQERGHQDYYFGNIRLFNKARQQKNFRLSPYGQPDIGMRLLRYVNSANFFPEQTQRESRYPRQCVVPSSAINCEIGFVSMGGFTFAFFKTIKDIPAGEELVTHYGSGWSDRLQGYAADCARRKREDDDDEMDVA